MGVGICSSSSYPHLQYLHVSSTCNTDKHDKAASPCSSPSLNLSVYIYIYIAHHNFQPTVPAIFAYLAGCCNTYCRMKTLGRCRLAPTPKNEVASAGMPSCSSSFSRNLGGCSSKMMNGYLPQQFQYIYSKDVLTNFQIFSTPAKKIKHVSLV